MTALPPYHSISKHCGARSDCRLRHAISPVRPIWKPCYLHPLPLPVNAQVRSLGDGPGRLDALPPTTNQAGSDAATLAKLHASGFLPEVWMPDEATETLRRLVAQRAQVINQMTRTFSRALATPDSAVFRMAAPPFVRRPRRAWRWYPQPKIPPDRTHRQPIQAVRHVADGRDQRGFRAVPHSPTGRHLASLKP